MLTSRPRGTADILPPDSATWQELERLAREHCARYAYSEIRTPTFEHSELFERGIGEGTDIVEKEMYTFLDRSERRLTLRPEGTAGVARAYIENGLHNAAQPVKLFYLGLPVFRYERPQAGRLREHHQFGVEVFGSDDPALDAEVIDLAYQFLTSLGLRELEVHLNSIGCSQCRARYREVLRAYYLPHQHELCSDCRRRLENNPLRLLDCKVEADQRLAAKAPALWDWLCPSCREHAEQLHEYLSILEIPVERNATIVRGLDYYTKTVFEIRHRRLGAQSTVCGGGRYNGLIKQLGGPDVPGIGFGMGMERLLITLAEEGIDLRPAQGIDCYLATVGEGVRRTAISLLQQLRRQGLRCELDYLQRGLKAQLKQADKLGARWVLLCAEEELQQGIVVLRSMKSGRQATLKLADVDRSSVERLGETLDE